MKNIFVGIISLILYMGASSAFGGASIDSTPIVAPGSNVTAQLVRNKNVMSISGTVYDLQPGDTYTVWWIVIEGGVLVINATGGIANGSGELHFGATLRAGTYDFMNRPRQVLMEGALVDPYAATVIFDVISHGPAIPGLIHEQISTISGGCAINGCSLAASFSFAP